MRILHITTRHLRGGAERNLAHTVGWQLAQGHEVEIALGCDSLDDGFPDGTVVHSIPELRREVAPQADLRARARLAALMTARGFDVVHTHQSKAGIIGRIAAANRSRTIVHTIHLPSFGPEYGRFRSHAFLAAERVCARKTDIFVAVGAELRREYQAAGVGHADEYLVIHSPIDIDRFAAVRGLDQKQRAEARKSLGLRPMGLVVATVGSLEPRKRIDLILRRLAPNVLESDVTIVVAGEGHERTRLEALATDLGIEDNTTFAGHVEDPERVFAAADVLVHASGLEGVPQVMIQALAAGMPVVATDTVGLREIPTALVTIVDPQGDGLGVAVSVIRPGAAPQLDISELANWRPEVVESGLSLLDLRLQQLMA